MATFTVFHRWSDDQRGWFFVEHRDESLDGYGPDVAARLARDGFAVDVGPLGATLILDGIPTPGWVARPGSRR